LQLTKNRINASLAPCRQAGVVLSQCLRPMCAGLLALGLSACGGGALRPASMEITVLGFNDLHGHLEPPGLAVTAQNAQGRTSPCPLAAWPTWPGPSPSAARPAAMWRWSRPGT
jgi:hypothetical protein